jgi:hypothetical protein
MKKTKVFLTDFFVFFIGVSFPVFSQGLSVPDRSFPDAGVPEQAQLLNDVKNDMAELYTAYYSGNAVDVADILEKTERLEGLPEHYVGTPYEKQALLTYIYSGEVVSSLYAAPENRQLKDRLDAFDHAMRGRMKTIIRDADLCLAYADYLYSRLSWQTDSAGIVNDLPVLYRRVLLLDTNNDAAKIKLALWHIYPASGNTANWNSFIRGHEPLLEKLSHIERFNGYILYSMFYMKTYDVQKGWDYLSRAETLFPQNPATAYVRYNYGRGKFSW